MLALVVGALGVKPSLGKVLWGTATAAYQVEGYREADGRTPSIWDAFDTPETSKVILAKRPDGNWRVYDGENAGRADEDFARYEESAQLTKEYGFGAARLSVSWTRVATYANGLELVRNDAGIAHYRAVIDAYKARGIKVALTMFHWDLPLSLEEHAALTGCASAWLCDWMPRVFGEYAGLLLEAFKDDVSYWITINEPLTIIQNGYSGAGVHAPGRCGRRDRCYVGDDDVEAYAAAKGLILAHGHAFKKWTQVDRPGEGLGITLNGDFRVAFTPDDVDAATRSLEWQLPLFFDPIFYGRWPASVSKVILDRSTKLAWTPEEIALVKDAHDGHLFMNTYTSMFAREPINTSKSQRYGFVYDAGAATSGYNFTSKKPIGTPSTTGWLFNYGKGIRALLNFYNNRYPNMTMIITENGWGNGTQSEDAEINDLERCTFYRDYVSNVSAAAVLDDVRVGAYFMWSLMDNYEWADGFKTRFGLTYVDYETQERTPKFSATYVRRFITPKKTFRDTLDLPDCDLIFRADGGEGRAFRDHRGFVVVFFFFFKYLLLPFLVFVSFIAVLRASGSKFSPGLRCLICLLQFAADCCLCVRRCRFAGSRDGAESPPSKTSAKKAASKWNHGYAPLRRGPRIKDADDGVVLGSTDTKPAARPSHGTNYAVV
ncbi:hypothetical protein CTAYLR_002008 [Chrysophaeum taylorii]|uniref:Uncharacterized protein n=1 Tax=Chrysophaeum taylorii TaxID=2483200 RepID=A0AAD7U8M0_9STRA|nr:hypothetical protein CTAYLR_002008 [Chrysophaeum taylorii]